MARTLKQVDGDYSECVERFEHMLLSRREVLIQVEKRLEAEEIALRPEASGALGGLHTPAEDGSDEGERQLVAAIAGQEIHAIQEIEDALARIRGGTYGLCESCEEMIPLRRLEAIPETRYCVECAEAEEAKERGPASRFQRAPGIAFES